MIKKILLSLGLVFCSIGVMYSQSTIKGTVTTEKGEVMALARVELKKDDKTVDLVQADASGNYQINGVAAGDYDMKVTGMMPCTKSVELKGIHIPASQVVFQDFTVNCSQVLSTVVVNYKRKVIDMTETESTIRIDGEQLRRTPGRDLGKALANQESAAVSGDGGVASVRGQRPEGQQTIVDGVRIRGGAAYTMAIVEEAQMIQGGIPAEYGDGTSFTVITTKGVPNDYHSSIELRGSIDGYNNFLAAGTVMGPIIKGKNDSWSPFGFMISAEGNYGMDSRPIRGGTWLAKEEVIEELLKHPVVYDPNEFGTVNSAASYVQKDAFYTVRRRPNADGYGFTVNSKFEIMPLKDKNNPENTSNKLRLTLQGSYSFGKGKGWSLSSILFNWTDKERYAESFSHDMRFGARLVHRIFRDDTAKYVKNISYELNFNYSRSQSLSQDHRLQKNIFAYGHFGKFKTTRLPYYSGGDGGADWTDSLGVVHKGVWKLETYYDAYTEWEPGPYNTDLQNYTIQFLENFNEANLKARYGENYNFNLETYKQFGAAINGAGPSVTGWYGFYTLPGMPASSGYSHSLSEAYEAMASLSMTIGNHELKLGYQLDNHTDRSWAVSATSLWTLMRQVTNTHFNQLDNLNYTFINDTITNAQLNNLDAQSTFDRNLRKKLGLNPDGTDYIDIDSYDPETFSLDMFSAEELLTGLGSPVISYRGYDYTGKKVYRKRTSITEFFAENAEGVKEYNIGAYSPTYMAMYIQDKFSINSLLFNVGLRLDRFDANQEVLKDNYLFREGVTVAQLKDAKMDLDANGVTRVVDNAQSDWVVYVNQKDRAIGEANDLSIVGYRSGNTWYDAKGQEINDPESSWSVNSGPLLQRAPDASAMSRVEGQAFKDYKPQWELMPRLSFSFPVSDNSSFIANYNIITQRPSNIEISPVSYLLIDKLGSGDLSNPNLKAQRFINYEINFKQKIGENSGLELKAYYTELRDMIQSYRFTKAYPQTYYSYTNQDFGTVQGFVVAFSTRQASNLTMRASYTLQFAKGTGSSSGSNKGIIASGQPNLRTLINLDFDQRHKLAVNIDYRFGGGANYNGPITSYATKDDRKKEIKWLENTGITVAFSAASGMPYSRSSVAYSGVGGAGSLDPRLVGSINGAHRPWIFLCNVRADKSFDLTFKKKDSREQKAQLTIYVDIDNIFNFKNVINVYRYTGTADDDGYLSSAQYQTIINSQLDVDAYRNYYQMVVRNPYNYSAPTTASLGVQFSF
ncbi:MAG: carboxypeptidase regulatory-like domain-containing protein [Bacteroidales bacterium]|jgi:hypothetical protein|nr:carboxypeptidase regulatory-like domain-containing protein [Bacteroidales bacterium]